MLEQREIKHRILNISSQLFNDRNGLRGMGRMIMLTCKTFSLVPRLVLI